ncbi:MAG TPA: hypothetical protein PLX08_06555 [Bacteroidales bacterium]|jgi:hypothetical protein|nr:hypothetical protein [Bacteroidales bacterium]
MKRIIIICLLCLPGIFLVTGCSASRKNYSELKGLMLLDNVKLGRNKAFYSKHNIKNKKEAHRRYKKNQRALNAKRS